MFFLNLTQIAMIAEHHGSLGVEFREEGRGRKLFYAQVVAVFRNKYQELKAGIFNRA